MNEYADEDIIDATEEAVPEEAKVVDDVDFKKLPLQDQKILQEMMVHGSVAKTAKVLGMSTAYVRRRLKLKRTRQEWDKLTDHDDLSTARKEIDMLGSDLASLLEEVKDAKVYKKVAVQCPSCDHKHSVTVQMIGYNTKLEAAKLIARMTSIPFLTDKKEIHNTNDTTIRVMIEWNPVEQIALSRLVQGQAIAPSMHRQLAEKAAAAGQQIPENPVVEAQYREVPNAPDNDTE